MRRRLLVAGTVALLVLLVPFAGSAGARALDDGSRPERGRRVERIRMVDAAENRFMPRRVRIGRGDRVRWINAGTLTHTTTSYDGLWDERLSPGDTFTRRFRQAGRFRFHCSIHPEMTGRIIVR